MEPFRSILIFGPPGSGKGTLGRELASSGGQYHLSSGDIFRGLSPESPAGRLYHSFGAKGLLVPDEATIEIWHSYVNGLIATNRYFPDQQYLLLDGVPRTVGQVEILKKHIDVKRIIVLDMDDEALLISRMQRRALLEKRADDADADILRKRMEVYQNSTSEVLKHYPDEIIRHFNGAQSPLLVLRDVLTDMADVLSEHRRPPGI